MWGRMETPKKQRGRPRKEPDRIPFWRFVRAGIAMCAYDEARQKGEKHSAAIAQAVAFVREHFAGMRISETELRRVLSMWRPKGVQTIFRFERSVWTDDPGMGFDTIREQPGILHWREGQAESVPPEGCSTSAPMIFQIRLSERPNYPRHNRKSPKD